MDQTRSVTMLLNSAAEGNAAAAEELLGLIYEQLRGMARARMHRQGAGDLLRPTELVHEAYLRLFGAAETPLEWNSRGHFFAAAALAMRNILVDEARRAGSAKRGGGRRRELLGDDGLAVQPASDDLLVLDELLTELERTDPRKAQLILLHCFSGLTLEETAAAMGVSLSTVEREWRFTRAVLRSRLEADAGEAAG